MVAWMGVALATVSALAGCLDEGSVTCADGLLCPSGFRCLPAGGCARDEQFAACEGAGREDGDACALDGLGAGVCEAGACIIAVCGNGQPEGAEACDDGNLLDGDGCDSHCLSTEMCGNGYRDPGEDCDDGNLIDGDGCQATCLDPKCGDGILDAGEVCDDGDVRPGDGCAYDCSSIEACGDGILDFAYGETCDDGNTRNVDGCGATCRLETYAWRNDTAATPPQRFVPAIAYDVARQRVVMFGGDDYGALLGDTWEWDGARWQRVAPVAAPSVRTQAAMVYDPDRQRLVLVGGQTLGGPRDDTWTYDGVTWTPGARAPFKRRGHAAAYDRARHALVVYGGLDEAGDERAETWELVDGTWTMTGLGPSARTQAAMTYDPVHGRTILFGGSLADQTPVGETWAYGGAVPAWTQLGGAGVEARVAPSLAFDPVRGAVVLYGGIEGGGEFHGEHHVLSADGATWTRVDYTITAPGRYAHGLAYDQARGEFVIFGGAIAGFSIAADTWTIPGGLPVDQAGWTEHLPAAQPPERDFGAMASTGVDGVLFGGSNSARLDDTWTYGPDGWAEQALGGSPAARWEFAAAGDTDRGVVVIFGGSDQTYQQLGDTWEFDGETWAQRSLTGPPEGFGHAMAYSAARDRVVLFGGSSYGNGGLVFHDDTWEWDGATWTLQSPATRPLARRHPGMAYDVIGERVVMFGGSPDEDGHVLDDTWAYDGAGQWQLVPSELSPPARDIPGLAFDPIHGRIVMFGGEAANEMFADTWELIGDAWTEVPTAIAPPGRFNHMLTYVPSLERTVLFGGYSHAFGTLADTWSLGYRQAVVGEACTADIDVDGDGLAGCADDECWQVCTPGCPPGTPAADCAALPHCGDGTCDGPETCRICPGDCDTDVGTPACPVRCGDDVCDPGEDAAGCPGDCSP